MPSFLFLEWSWKMNKSTMTRRDERVRKSTAVVTNGIVAAPCESKAEKLVAARQTPEQFMDACEEAIRDLAYLKWEEAGCPSGDGHDFWLDAEREVVAARSDAMSMRP